jgi:two-component system, cell cycle response regulator
MAYLPAHDDLLHHPSLLRSVILLLVLASATFIAIGLFLLNTPSITLSFEAVALGVLIVIGFFAMLVIAVSAIRNERQLAEVLTGIASAVHTSQIEQLPQNLHTTPSAIIPVPIATDASTTQPDAPAPIGLSESPTLSESETALPEDPMLHDQTNESMAVVETLTELAAVCTAALKRQRAILRELEGMSKLLPQSPSHDPLTGALNHSALMQRLIPDVEFAQQHQRPLALAIFDIDNFHTINITYGYRFGDEVLFTVAERIRSELSENEMLSRLGGDRFAIVWPGLNTQQAQVAVERVMAAVKQGPLLVMPEDNNQHAGETVRISVRAGLAICPDDGYSAQALLDLALDALSHATKETGPRLMAVNTTSQTTQTTHISHDEQFIADVDTNELPVITKQMLPQTPPPATPPQPAPEQDLVKTPRSYIDMMTQTSTSIQALTSALESQDPDSFIKSRRLAELAEETALLLNRSVEEARLVGLGALLHDVGNLGIPSEILQKPEALTAEEWAFVRKHPHLGERLLSSIGGVLAAVASIVASHREHWDGRGYPAGLAGEAIPLGARIVAVCDTYGAMTSTRPYRGAYTHEEAVAELRRYAGTQFDPAVVEAFIMALEQEHDRRE